MSIRSKSPGWVKERTDSVVFSHAHGVSGRWLPSTPHCAAIGKPVGPTGQKLGTSMQHEYYHLPLHLIFPRAVSKLFEQVVLVYVKWMVSGGAVGIIILARAVRKHSG